jgi:plasmid stabilization system protein ParE
VKIVVGAAARQEIEEAKSWYDRQQDGLGLRFVRTIEATILRTVRFPMANSEIAPGIRRALVADFPYMVIYACEADLLSVIAVAHQHRRPGYWHDRQDG